jgi:hypothetical protein
VALRPAPSIPSPIAETKSPVAPAPSMAEPAAKSSPAWNRSRAV